MSTRAFAHKINRLHASDVRRQVAPPSNNPVELPDSASRTSIASNNVSFYDIAEPMDFEECVTQRRGNMFESLPGCVGGSPRRLIEFPPDDIQLKVVKRDVPTIDPPFPIDVDVKSLNAHTRDLLIAYNSDFSIIERKYECHSTGDAHMKQIMERGVIIHTLPKQMYEKENNDLIDYDSDAASNRNSFDWSDSEIASRESNVSVLPGITTRLTPRQMDASNDAKRGSGRHSNLMILTPTQMNSQVIEIRNRPPLPSDRITNKLIVKVMGLNLDFEFEPLFASAALYDAKERKKISENFYFDCNSQNLKGLLSTYIPYEDASTLSKTACFNITQSSNDLFLVIKLEKVLQPLDISEACEPYLKDDKSRDKVIGSMGEWCERLGAYRMPLAWTMIDIAKVISGASTLSRCESSVISPSEVADSDSLMSVSTANSDRFSSAGSLRRIGSGSQFSLRNSTLRPSTFKCDQLDIAALNSLQPIVVTSNTFFRQDAERLSDDDLFKLLAETRKGSSLAKRLKCIGGLCKLELSSGGDDMANRLSPELLRLEPFVRGGNRDVEFVKEILEFPLRDVFTPNYSYRNLLYIYPKSLNLSSRPGSGGRNLAIKMELLEAESRAMPVIYGKSSGPQLSTFAFCSVLYHNKTPQMQDEIKVNIPIDLNETHHLLFTIYHITCKEKQSECSNDTPIAYTWIPLIRDGRLQTGDFSIPVSLDPLPSSYYYMAPQVNMPNMKWVDNHKPVFNITLSAVSTVHSQDVHIDSFIRIYHWLKNGGRELSQEQALQAIRNLTKATPEPLVQFLYIILDKLLDLMVHSQTLHINIANLASTCFEMIGQLVKILSKLLDEFCDQHARSTLFTSYIHFHKMGSEAHNFGGLESSRRSPSDTRHLLDIIKGFEKATSNRVTIPDASSIPLSNGVKCLHEELLKQYVNSEGANKETCISNAWFFLELLIKGMAENLANTNRLFLPRKLRFGDEFILDFGNLVALLTQQVVDRSSRTMHVAHNVNSSLAFLVRDALSFMDRTFIMGQIRHYCKYMMNSISCAPENTLNLMSLKIDFIRIVCSHEHFVLLNLPLISNTYCSMQRPTPPSPSPSGSSCNSLAAYSSASGSSIGAAELTAEFRSKHFLVGLLLTDLASVLEMSYCNLHSRAIGLLRNLLMSHDMDERLLETGVKSRVALLYIPLLGIVLDSCTQLHDPFSKKSNQESNVVFDIHEGPGLNPKIAMAISGVPSTPQQTQIGPTCLNGRTVLTLQCTRNLLASFCWVLKNLDEAVLKNWVKELSAQRITQLLDVLQLCISCYEYKEEKDNAISNKTAQLKQKLENALLGKSSNVSLLRQRRAMTPGGGSVERVESLNESSSVRWRKENIQHKASINSHEYIDPGTPELWKSCIIESNLSTELSLIVVDTLELVLRICAAADSHSVNVLPLVMRVILHMLSTRQSLFTMQSLFNTQRSFVAKFPELLFEDEIEQCSDLCLQLLRLCAGGLAPIRSQSSASLYLLMRHSFESANSFSRVKMQMTVALSTLVSSSFNTTAAYREANLRASLKTVLTYTDMDIKCDVALGETSFMEQVKDLIFNLHMILSDTVKMNEFSNDFEMLIDLMYRIAKGYQNNADLRLAWLQNMACKHAERGNYAEAASCLLHAAALATEYMHMIEDVDHHPAGAVTFLNLSDNVLEESAVSDDVISPHDDGSMCQGKYFCGSGLVALLDESAEYMYQAFMFETMHNLYIDLMMPILLHTRDYARIAQIHSRLQEAMSKIDPPLKTKHPPMDLISPAHQHDKRIFGTFFRVGFYGMAFGDLDGQEYVYKEPAITKLAEISHRLHAFYSERFDKIEVEVIKDSNKVNIEQLDRNKAFLQITYVEPYFDKWELRRRLTVYERCHNVRRFVFATPYTSDGRAHGDLANQYKRKTIVTTSHSFPYIKTRIIIVHKEMVDLCPIQVAIEDIQKKTRELSAATAPEPPDPKMLQMVLQGCIGTTVNQGPMEIANVFLSDLLEGSKPMNKHQNKLRLCFKDFSKKCADALRENKRLVGADQREYQRELERNYVHFTEKLAPMICFSAINTIRHTHAESHV